MAPEEEEDVVPMVGSPAVSEKLAARLSGMGMCGLAPILANLGVLTFSCLGKLTAEELAEISRRLRAAGFGPGYACSLRSLHGDAQQETSAPSTPGDRATDAAVASTANLSPRLRARLAAAELQRTEAVVAQAGLRTSACLDRLAAEELQEVAQLLAAGGFSEKDLQAFQALKGLDTQTATSEGREEKELQIAEDARVHVSIKHKACDEDKENEERPRKALRAADAAEARPSTTPLAATRSNFEAESPSETLSSQPRETERASKVQPSKLESVPLMGDARERLTRQRIENTLCHSRAIQAEIVKYRDRVSGKLVESRIPSAVLALLRLRASCSGKPVSDLRLARMAADVMEEHAFDPVRAVASLSPSSILCPTGALRVLGSGFIGTVFLEEETGEVAKVMLDDFAKKEYDLCRAFANARLAPAPIALEGPCCVPGGELYCIRMERITNTLGGVLCAKSCRGLRHGLHPPEVATARRIGSAMVQAFQDMFAAGLVHGDLHLHNAGVLDVDTNPTIQLIDFGRAASKAACVGKPCNEAFRAGHEYDVCRFVGELCQAFDELQYEFEEVIQECQKELRELKRTKEAAAPETDWQLHHARQIGGLQAFLEEEPKGLEQAEAAFNAVLSAVMNYAMVRLDLSAEGGAVVRNRRLRQACKKRENACYKVYFKSDLFWGPDA